MHTRHRHVCQHWHCTVALGTTSQTLHTLQQFQVHHWACSLGLLALLDGAFLPCFCSLPVTPLCLPCPPAMQEGAVGTWVQTVPGSLSTLPPGTASHRWGDLGEPTAAAGNKLEGGLVCFHARERTVPAPASSWCRPSCAAHEQDPAGVSGTMHEGHVCSGQPGTVAHAVLCPGVTPGVSTTVSLGHQR